jgi:hypothetical protein
MAAKAEKRRAISADRDHSGRPSRPGSSPEQRASGAVD